MGGARDATISITFDGALDEGSVTVTDPLGVMAGTLTVNSDTVNFAPETDWHVLGTYTVQVGAGIVRKNGSGAVSSPHEFSFQVVDGQWQEESSVGGTVGKHHGAVSNTRGDILYAYETTDAIGNIRAVYGNAGKHHRCDD